MSKEVMQQALHRAFKLGQKQWSWADSEYPSRWKKADGAKAEFDQLVQDTINSALAAHLPAQPEPVAWISPDYFTAFSKQGFQVTTHKIAPGLVPLYTAPPQRQPLTDEEQAELLSLRKFRDDAFLAHPNIDIDIEASVGIGAKP